MCMLTKVTLPESRWPQSARRRSSIAHLGMFYVPETTRFILIHFFRLDPSIRVVYHPSSKFVSTSGFLARTTTHSFSQTISIHNTKSIPVHNLRVLEHIPISNDEEITVKIIDPALPTSDTSYTSSGLDRQINVGSGIFAQWSKGDHTDSATLGKDGKLEWVCTVEAFGKINLTLRWELSTTGKGEIRGLF